MSMTGDKILITGASGSLGKQLIYELDRKGVKPVAHVRETSDTSYIDAVGLEKRYADLRNEAEVEKLVQGIDGIIHTAAWVNFRKDRLTQFTGINTIAVVGLFKAAQQAGVKRFVHVSTVAAVAAFPRDPDGKSAASGAESRVNEETPFNLGHLRIPYIMTKRAAEEELLKSASDGKTELVIVNPSIMVAPSRTGDDRGKAMKKFPRFLAPDFPNRINLVDIRDVASGVIAALSKGRPSERYILAGDDISVKDLVLAISSILGRVPHLVRIPRPVLDLAARGSMMCRKLLGKTKISFYPDLVKMLDFEWVYSSAKARRELGYTTRSVHITLNDLLTNNFIGTYAKPAGEDLVAQ
jgi:dihydroflavonol-4-reductase